MIDLHTHTKYSDGTWDVEKLLQEAEKAKLEVLSITDHDTLNAYYKLNNIDYKSIYKGQILPGIEINTVYDGIKFELLAYGFDFNKLNKWVRENYENKEPNLDLEFESMYKNCKEHNLKIDNVVYNKQNGWPVDILYASIKKYEENKKYFTDEEWNDVDVFYNSCITKKKFPVYVDFSMHYPTAEIVSKNVRECGGKVFIAHAYRYNLEDTIAFLDTLKENNIIDGVEVYHSTFSSEETETLKKYCAENNLLMSGGSDCHGDKKKQRRIGTGNNNLNIHKSILCNWNIEDKMI